MKISQNDQVRKEVKKMSKTWLWEGTKNNNTSSPRPKKIMLCLRYPDWPYFIAPTLNILLENWLMQKWKVNTKLKYHLVGIANLLVIE